MRLLQFITPCIPSRPICHSLLPSHQGPQALPAAQPLLYLPATAPLVEVAAQALQREAHAEQVRLYIHLVRLDATDPVLPFPAFCSTFISGSQVTPCCILLQVREVFAQYIQYLQDLLYPISRLQTLLNACSGSHCLPPNTS
jgi:hypothetical protein